MNVCLYWQEKQNAWADETAAALKKARDLTYSLQGDTMCLEGRLPKNALPAVCTALAQGFIRCEQPRLILALVEKQLPQLSEDERSFLAEFATALARQNGMHADNDIYVRKLSYRLSLCLEEGTLHLGGFSAFRVQDFKHRWQGCIQRVVSLAVLRYDWAQQLDAWRVQVDRQQSKCELVRVQKNRKGQFVMEVKGYQGSAPEWPNEQMAEERLLNILLAWAPERIEILMGRDRQESWVYEIIEQVFGQRVLIRWCQH